MERAKGFIGGAKIGKEWRKRPSCLSYWQVARHDSRPCACASSQEDQFALRSKSRPVMHLPLVLDGTGQPDLHHAGATRAAKTAERQVLPGRFCFSFPGCRPFVPIS